jgi:putative ABC transport system permease protein
MSLNLRDNIKVAVDSIKSNKLRAIITMLIIAIGIMALVGIFTAIDAIKNGINSNFTDMGANTFTIRNGEFGVRVGKRGRKAKRFEPITYKDAMRFKTQFDMPCLTSISTLASQTSRLKSEGEKTNPNIQVFGTDENYLQTSGYELAQGRNFTAAEANSGKNIVIIGKDIDALLFPRSSGYDKIISIGALKYKVVGVLKPKGSSAAFGGDKICIIPLTNARQYFGGEKMDFTINVMVTHISKLEVVLEEGRGLFRKIRHVSTTEDDDFAITKSDSLATMLIDDLNKVTMGATIIGIITLLGAAIGLMNILLVTVTERTREIGIRKALGATQQTIKNQFLIESIVICVFGGSIGILLGIIIGNLISMALDTGFFVPWFWMMSGYAICVIVGLVSGYIPAKRASQLDPIESLRFE